MTPAYRVLAVAQRVGRLRPDWRDPERYFANRNELEKELRRLARALEVTHG